MFKVLLNIYKFRNVHFLFFLDLFSMVLKQHGIIWKKIILIYNQLKKPNNLKSPWEHFVNVSALTNLIILSILK